MSGRSHICRPRALLFDMDGTITEPMLDFPGIKADMGIGSRPILEALAEMDDAARERAQAVLHAHEEQAARHSKLNTGCDDLIAWIRRADLRTALITRNSRRSVSCVLEKHGLEFDVLLTREDGKYKPDRQPLLIACQRLNVESAQAWMIGDGAYDVAAGHAAGIRTVWISHGRRRDFEHEPWRTVRDLPELLTLLAECRTDQ